MVKHIILWTLKEEYTDAQKAEIRAGIKEGLEGLKGQIPGMIDISVRTEYLPSSTVDVMLDTTFENAEALAAYATHPKHVAVADRDRKSTRLNSSHYQQSRMPSSA